jgi:hypothetical protein
MLTLVIVPAAFTVVDDIEQWLGPKVSRLLTAHPPAPQPVAANEPRATS